MDFKDLIRFGFDKYLDYLKRALSDLTTEERRFQPTPESNHIDFTVWHMARVEDDWIQRFAQHTSTVWQRDNWHGELGLPEKENGFEYTAQKVSEMPTFSIDRMLDYYDAVRVETNKYIDSISEADLGTEPHPRRPGFTVGEMFSHLVVEEAQHVGQVAYIRGIQRGLDN